MIKLKEGDIFDGQIEFLTNGNATLPNENTEIFIYKKNTYNSLHLDTVRVEIFKAKEKLEGKVIEVISRNKKEFVGRVQIKNKTTFFIPDSNKIYTDFYVKGGLIAENGQRVVIELTKWDDPTKSPQCKIINILGNSGDNDTEMNAIMIEFGLPVEFPADVLKESQYISEIISDGEIKNRKDMRDITTFTIDPATAKDFDDALSVNIIADDKIEVGVHIADVGYYVRQGSKIDEEAYKRGTSVYLVDRCVPMLPEKLSNGVCSLNPNQDRLSFSVIFTMNKNGKILDTWIGKTIIHSNRRYSYEEAQEIIEGNNGDYQDEIRLLDQLAQKIRKERIKNGSIEINGVEVKFELADDNKKPIGVYFKEQKEANKLIEEFMLLANKTVAKTLKEKLKICVNRVHPRPNIDKLVELKDISNNLGYEFNMNEDINILKENLNKLSNDIKDTPEENMISSLIVRCQSKAYYTTEDISHFGLGFKDYAHFTSPIRRYSDVLIHRLLESIV